jgi:hypothetical protein
VRIFRNTPKSARAKNEVPGQRVVTPGLSWYDANQQADRLNYQARMSESGFFYFAKRERGPLDRAMKGIRQGRRRKPTYAVIRTRTAG